MSTMAGDMNKVQNKLIVDGNEVTFSDEKNLLEVIRKAGIEVTMFVDSAAGVALDKEQGTKQVNKVFLGSDALLDKGIINKIGSETISRIAEDENIPVYIIADSWK